jgi:hypothetical protein
MHIFLSPCTTLRCPATSFTWLDLSNGAVWLQQKVLDISVHLYLQLILSPSWQFTNKTKQNKTWEVRLGDPGALMQWGQKVSQCCQRSRKLKREEGLSWLLWDPPERPSELEEREGILPCPSKRWRKKQSKLDVPASRATFSQSACSPLL